MDKKNSFSFPTLVSCYLKIPFNGPRTCFISLVFQFLKRVPKSFGVRIARGLQERKRQRVARSLRRDNRK